MYNLQITIYSKTTYQLSFSYCMSFFMAAPLTVASWTIGATVEAVEVVATVEAVEAVAPWAAGATGARVEAVWRGQRWPVAALMQLTRSYSKMFPLVLYTSLYNSSTLPHFFSPSSATLLLYSSSTILCLQYNSISVELLSPHVN